jgi:hypothetical protein
MNNTDKAISAVRRIDKRIAELEQQLTMTSQEVQTAEAEAAALAGESGFDGAVDRIARATARRTALGAALAKLNEERHLAVLAVAEARRAFGVVEKHWGRVLALADVLDARGELSHEEVLVEARWNPKAPAGPSAPLPAAAVPMARCGER